MAGGGIDAHQHFWRYDATEYGWIGAGMEVLGRDYLPEDLEPSLAAEGLAGSVAVQARQTPAETAFLLDLARRHPRVLGVVGWLDLRADDVTAQLDALAGEPYLVGLRHVVQDEPDERFLLREDFLRGVRALAGRDLVYDVLIYPRQLPAALEFVERCPEVPLVLDHAAKPPIRSTGAAPDRRWAEALEALGLFPNLTCKVSGLVTEGDWGAWTPADIEPHLDTVLEAFGPERLLFGSDWPVCLLAADYGRVASLVHDWAERRLDAAQRRGLFGGNAARVYGLAPTC